MPVEENVALMQRWFKEVWNEGRVQTIYDLMDKDAIGIGQDQPGVEIHGPRDFEALYNRLRGAFPDISITVEDAFGAGDRAVVRWSAVMTHTGDHLGVPATNRLVRVTGITIAQIRDGKIIRGWDNWDQLSLTEQLAARRAAH